MALRIEGAVDRPCNLGFTSLRELAEQIDDVGTLVSGRHGGAVALRAVLAGVRVDPRADHLTVEADDGSFAASVPLDAVADAVLVYRSGENELPRDQGGPVRLLIPDAARCGRAEVDTCANVKHVSVMRLDVGRGRDTRPTTRDEHAAIHAKQPARKRGT
jgi:DMSO/TMAO reductase YedYZ molybdopterin-dependent catalytic subunit